MKQASLQFIIAVFLVSAGLEFVSQLAWRGSWISSGPTFSVLIIATLAGLTVALFFFLQNIQQSDPPKFLQRYLLTITLKMVVGCVLILAVIFMDRASATANALLFIASYFSLTAIEIFFLLKGRAPR